MLEAQCRLEFVSRSLERAKFEALLLELKQQNLTDSFCSVLNIFPKNRIPANG